ncbi:MAG: 1-deoxy-D-xylulose-5-phosphate reductoisomerase [Dehalococcoidia bacterium]
MKQLVILGSTGSIGRQTLEVVRSLSGDFRVLGLAGGRNTGLLSRQVAEFGPRFVCYQGGGAKPPGERVSLEELACSPEADIVMVATSGSVGLAPTLAAIRAGKAVALANKEVLVMAGEVVMAQARLHRARIMPVDSEHSAIWQCLRGEGRGSGRRGARIFLTASGGPFRSRSREELARVTPREALDHPTWKMGKKVTIDSATLMNKGMEAIEAHWFFDIPWEDIQVLIHPESIVHSLVEFPDGSVKAQLAAPDMRLPIQYALTYPRRRSNPGLPRLDLARLGALHFEAPDLERFPCLRLALEAGRAGGTCPAVLSAADEVAVELFEDRHIGFLGIPRLVEKVLEGHDPIPHPNLEDIMSVDAWARDKARDLVSSEGSTWQP